MIRIIFCLLILFSFSSCTLEHAKKFSRMSYYHSLDSLTNDERLDKIKRIIDQDPKNMLAHQMFLYFGAKKDLSFFENQYKIWMRKFPKAGELPLAFGYVLNQYKNHKAVDFFALAVEINPKLPNVWNYLYLDAYFKFDSLGMEDYLKKGIQANPNDAKLAFLMKCYTLKM